MKKSVYLGAILAITISLASCGPAYLSVEPSYVEYARPARPSASYIWIDGDWTYSRQSQSYNHGRGRWEQPRSGQSYKEGYWKQDKHGKKWEKGRWKKN